MKKMLGVALILLGHCVTVFSQSENFRAYNENVNQAELSIVLNDYRKALQYYDIAFSRKDKPFAKDLYNASVAAIKLKEYDTAFTYCDRLGAAGVGAAFFEKNLVFVPLHKYRNWKPLTEKAQYVKKGLDYENKQVLTILKGLVDKDVGWHTRWAKSDYNRELEMQLAAADDSISGELMKVFEEHGFLSEDILGANVKDETRISNPDYWIIMLHNYQGRYGNADTLFTPILRKALKQGKISPMYFASIQDLGSSVDGKASYGSERQFMIYGCTLYQDTITYFHEAWKQARKDIGLNPGEDDDKRIMYNEMYPDNDFMLEGRSGRVGSFANKDSEVTFLTRMKVIIKTLPSCNQPMPKKQKKPL